MIANLEKLGTISRRNSELRYETQGDGNVLVKKRYHSTFSAHAEYRTYQRIAPVVTRVYGVRLPQTWLSPNDSEVLAVEYIEGSTLAAYVQRGRYDVVRENEEVIVSLLVSLRSTGMAVDADPSNMIIEPTGTLVLIDPLTEASDLEDHAAVVFLIGMLKAFLRSLNPGWVFQFAYCWRTIYSQYLAHADGLTGSQLDVQLCAYAGRIIRWNLEDSAGESSFVRTLRVAVVVPFWAMVGLLMRSGCLSRGCSLCSGPSG